MNRIVIALVAGVILLGSALATQAAPTRSLADWLRTLKDPQRVSPEQLVAATQRLLRETIDARKRIATLEGKFQKLETDPRVVMTYLPRGTILPWYKRGVPAGWVLCNGATGTPDLRGRVPMGDDGRRLGVKGGGKATIPALSVSTTADHFTSPKGTHGPRLGPRVREAWGHFHRLTTVGSTAKRSIDVVPAHVRVVYIMKK